jgi:hypothetical protein
VFLIQASREVSVVPGAVVLLAAQHGQQRVPLEAGAAGGEQGLGRHASVAGQNKDFFSNRIADNYFATYININQSFLVNAELSESSKLNVHKYILIPFLRSI